MTARPEAQQFKPVIIICGHDTGFCQKTVICFNWKMQVLLYWEKFQSRRSIASFYCLFNSGAKITIDVYFVRGRASLFSELLHNFLYRNNILWFAQQHSILVCPIIQDSHVDPNMSLKLGSSHLFGLPCIQHDTRFLPPLPHHSQCWFVSVLLFRIPPTPTTPAVLERSPH